MQEWLRTLSLSFSAMKTFQRGQLDLEGLGPPVAEGAHSRPFRIYVSSGEDDGEGVTNQPQSRDLG